MHLAYCPPPPNSRLPNAQCDQMLELKSTLIVLKKVTAFLTYLRATFFKVAQKVTKSMGYFCFKFVPNNFHKSPNLVSLTPVKHVSKKLSLDKHKITTKRFFWLKCNLLKSGEGVMSPFFILQVRVGIQTTDLLKWR